MALTNNCDVFASVSEGMFNKFIENVARQRPSLFNYGTTSFVANPELMCQPIKLAPKLPASQPRVGQQGLLPVPGTGGAWGLEFCIQLTNLLFDFHPGNIALPPELLPPLAEQTFALQAQVCGGIACPSEELLRRISDQEARRYPSIDPRDAIRGNQKKDDTEKDLRQMQPVPFSLDFIHCFCLDLFVIMSFRRVDSGEGPLLAMDLRRLELVDIKPDELENSIECLIRTTISLGVLPRLRLVLDDIVMSLGKYGSLTIGFTPISAAVPFNPSVAKDQLSVFINASAS